MSVQHCNNGIFRKVEKYELMGTAANCTVYNCNFFVVAVVTHFSIQIGTLYAACRFKL
jgi:hypothetical protein